MEKSEDKSKLDTRILTSRLESQQPETSNQIEKRERESQEDSRASKAIRTYNSTRARSNRSGDTVQDGPSSEILRISGESRWDVARNVITNQSLTMDDGRMCDAIDSVESGGPRENQRRESAYTPC